MRKKEMIAMLLAGGQGSRLGILTKNLAKPAVTFGGKYRIIDFPLSNCINSGVDTVGVLTQYQPLALNRHIGIGTSWDLDRESGGVAVLAPRVKNGEHGEWYSGTANAIFQNVDFIDRFDPVYVLILSGDHIYKMDYSKMLDFHKEKKCDVTIAVHEVTLDEATRLGIMNTEDDDRIYEFEEKPKNPKSNLASMGIYIFSWKVLRKSLLEDNKIHNDSDFGKHIIPSLMENQNVLYAYRFTDYWKDVGTIESYWQANMELIKTLPDFNLYDDFWKIYTNSDHQPPIYTSADADVKTSMAAEGCEIYGKVYNSVLGPGVVISKNSRVQDSIILENTVIGEGCDLYRTIVAENCVIGNNVKIGTGENTPNIDKPQIYNTGITVIGDYSTVPDNVTIGKNCIVFGETDLDMYKEGTLESGHSIVKEAEAE